MRCPFCSFDSTRVVDSRLSEPGDSVRRRRECAQCGERFTTYERAEEAPVTVIKRDGRRERFDRQKIVRGLLRAANKRPVSEDQLEELADSIAAAVRRGGSETDAERIGELSLRGLARLDPVSAILFASVYRRFADLAELEDEVRRLKDEPVATADQMPLDDDPIPSGPPARIGGPPQKGSEDRTSRRRDHAGQP
jgi:transcriptional repressor NrdR